MYTDLAIHPSPKSYHSTILSDNNLSPVFVLQNLDDPAFIFSYTVDCPCQHHSDFR